MQQNARAKCMLCYVYFISLCCSTGDCGLIYVRMQLLEIRAQSVAHNTYILQSDAVSKSCNLWMTSLFYQKNQGVREYFCYLLPIELYVNQRRSSYKNILYYYIKELQSIFLATFYPIVYTIYLQLSCGSKLSVTLCLFMYWSA